MTCPTRRDARWFARAGAPAYLYRFAHAPNVMGGKAGAFHGAELVSLFPSVFKSRGLVYTDEDRKLAEVMIGYWARFAATGDPRAAARPRGRATARRPIRTPCSTSCRPPTASCGARSATCGTRSADNYGALPDTRGR
jgi:carboxylesterase type B